VFDVTFTKEPAGQESGGGGGDGGAGGGLAFGGWFGGGDVIVCCCVRMNILLTWSAVAASGMMPSARNWPMNDVVAGPEAPIWLASVPSTKACPPYGIAADAVLLATYVPFT